MQSVRLAVFPNRKSLVYRTYTRNELYGRSLDDSNLSLGPPVRIVLDLPSGNITSFQTGNSSNSNELFVEADMTMYIVIGDDFKVQKKSSCNTTDKAVPISNSMDLKGWTRSYVTTITPNKEIKMVRKFRSDYTLTFTTDQQWRIAKRMVNGEGSFLSKQNTSTEVTTMSMLLLENVDGAVFSSDGKQMLILTNKSKITIYDSNTWEPTGKFYVCSDLVHCTGNPTYEVYMIQFSPSNPDLVCLVDNNFNVQLLSLSSV